MARKGKDFEELVARIERCMQKTGGVVTSPDYIRDRETGELREVDASVRIQAGSADLLIIIECRQRKSRQGSKWIEELAGKRDSVGANKVIAVTDLPISGPARTKAQKRGIDLRLLRKANLADIAAWFRVPGMIVQAFRPDYDEARVILDFPDCYSDQQKLAVTDELKRYGTNEQFIHIHPAAKVLSVEEVFRAIDFFANRDRMPPPDGTRKLIQIEILNGGQGFVDASSGRYRIRGFLFNTYVTAQKAVIAPSRVLEYGNGEEADFGVAEFDLDLAGNTRRFTIGVDKTTGDIHVALPEGAEPT